MEFQRYEAPTNVLAGDFATFPLDSGPGTFIVHVFGALATGQTLRVRVLCRSNYVQAVGTYYVIEDVTLSPHGGHQSGYQSLPIPMLDDQWSFYVLVELFGGVDADISYVALKL